MRTVSDKRQSKSREAVLAKDSAGEVAFSLSQADAPYGAGKSEDPPTRGLAIQPPTP